MANDHVHDGCTRDFSCCSGDHECKYRLSENPGHLAQNMALVSPEIRTLREILFNHRALAGATALEITELMVELQGYIERGPSHQHCSGQCESFKDGT